MISKTTLLGALGASIAALNIDYEKLSKLDHAELTKLGLGVVVGLLGKFSQDSVPAKKPD